MKKKDNHESAKELSAIRAFFEQHNKPEFRYRGRNNFPLQQRLLRLAHRQDFQKKYLSSAKAFSRYIEKHPERDVTKTRITAELALAGPSHEILAYERDDGRLIQQPEAEQYRLLAEAHYVDPHLVFPEVPGILHLCELKALFDAYLKINDDLSAEPHKQITAEWNAALAHFNHRWYLSTGKALAAGEIPRVEDITDRLAPVPLVPGWSLDLYSREARSMTPVLTGNSQKGLNGEENERRAVAHRVVAEEGGEGEGEAEGESATALSTCDLDNLFAAAGGKRPRQPNADTPRYTFPGRLDQKEDIFYDYAVMIPIKECGPLQDERVGVEPRTMSAIRVLAGETFSVLDFLDVLNLSPALGEIAGGVTVVQDLRQALQDVLNVDHNTPLHEVHAWKRRFAELGALVRSASRRQMFLGRLAGTDPIQFLTALDTALRNVPQYKQYQEDKIQQRHVPEGTQLATYLEINGLRIGEVRPIPNEPNMGIDYNQQFHRTKHYFEYLGGPFYDILRNLVDAAQQMYNAVDSVRGNAPQIRKDFEHLAEGKINEAALVLSRLLDDISEQLPLWSERLGEGSKRLALMVVYRQYWHPEGYVKGKLVGHKTLLPDQKESLKRRTLIKTTRETTTVEEFTASRAEDFSQSLKETAELIEESSSRFKLTTSTSGKFDILIADLDVTIGTDLDLSSLSKSTQSRVAEAVRKSAVKYSEKREVKVRELTEVEDLQESTTELANSNREITANYFYYQLLRQYIVTMELNDIRPVLLRTRDVPASAAVDDKFISDHAHVLIHTLPAQLSADMVEYSSKIEALARALVRHRAGSDKAQVAYEQFRQSTPPITPEERSHWQAELQSMERKATEARELFIEADDVYSQARTRLDRLIKHVRENICFYMHHIWQASPPVDHNKMLHDEEFAGIPLPQLTRGLVRLGYYGNEEIFEFAGPSVAAADVLVRNTVPGMAIARDENQINNIKKSPVFEQLKTQFSADGADTLVEKIRRHLFLRDPVGEDDTFRARRVQLAQDALVVDAMPGNVPLLEGFQMAHRMLDVQEKCLENVHLSERISDRPWKREGEDSYRVSRREGEPLLPRKEGP